MFEAKTSRDLDPYIRELSNLQEQAGYQEGQKGRNLVAFQQFLSRWQTQLEHREAGQTEAAFRVLRNLRPESYEQSSWINQGSLTVALEKAKRALGKPSPEELKKRISDITGRAMTAASAKDIDPLLTESQKLQEFRDYDENEDSQRISRLSTFLKGLQDVFIAREQGDLAKLKQAVENLKNSSSEPESVPRSAMREFLLQLQGSPGGQGNGSKKPQAMLSAEAWLAKMTDLQSLSANLPSLRQAVQADPYGNSGYSWSILLPALVEIEQDSRNLEQGNGGRLLPRIPDSPERVTRPEFVELQRQHDLLALEMLFGEVTGVKPGKDETHDRYLARVLPKLLEKNDWQNVLLLAKAANLIRPNSAPVSKADQTALQLYLSGLKQEEKAEQFSVAVVCYQRALAVDASILPMKEIGERLERIHKERPADYELGTQWLFSGGGPLTGPVTSGLPPMRPGSGEDSLGAPQVREILIPARTNTSTGR